MRLPLAPSASLAAVVATTLASGCVDTHGPGQNTSLADLPGLTVHASVGPTWGNKLLIRYDEAAFTAQTGAPCASLGDLEATFNGVPMTVSSYGSWVEQDDFGDSYCNYPALATAHRPQPGAATEIKLTDGTRDVTAHYAIDQLTWRFAELVTPFEWVFTSGTHATLAWSHEQDLGPDTTFRVDYWDSAAAFEVRAALDGSRIGLDFPSFVGRGDGELSISITNATLGGDAATCDGADACTWSAEGTYRHRASLR